MFSLISVLCCLINYHKLNNLKQQSFSITISVGQKAGNCLAELWA